MSLSLSLQQLNDVAVSIQKHLQLFGVQWIKEDAMSIYSHIWYSTVDSDIYKIELNVTGIILSVNTGNANITSQRNWQPCESLAACSVPCCVGVTLADAASEHRLFSQLAYAELQRRYEKYNSNEPTFDSIIESITNATGRNVVVYRGDISPETNTDDKLLDFLAGLSKFKIN
jgi:hypothetical protein